MNEQEITALTEVLAQLALTALQAWSQASGTPITQESVMALLPNQTPLSPPDEV